MATETWHYQENQFDNATKGSFRLMNIINADHLAKLQAQNTDPDILALQNRTTPVHDAFNLNYSGWLSTQAIYKGETNRMQTFIDDLANTKSKQWDAQIQVVFLEGTSDYIVILPKGRKPFYSGTIDDRISQLQGLGARLANYPVLAATMNDVNLFFTNMNAQRDVQQQKEQQVDNASDNVEIARFNIAVMMYRNLGFLIDKYGSTPEFISNFWELALFRSTPPAENISEPINGSVGANATANILNGGFSQTTQFVLRNTGSVPLVFCLAGTATDVCADGITVNAGADLTVSAQDLGPAANTFLNVTNNNADAGNWQVILINV